MMYELQSVGIFVGHFVMVPFKSMHITKTCLYNFDPLKPHFNIVKLGFTGVYIIFHISAQKHRLWVLVSRGGPNEYPQSMFLSRNMKNIRNFYLKIFIFRWENFQYV